MLDCENDLGLIEVPSKSAHSKNMKNTQHQTSQSATGHHHQKTKSEGATPLGTAYIKAHYHGSKKDFVFLIFDTVKPKMQPIPLSMIN
jgi:hypothetical protein